MWAIHLKCEREGIGFRLLSKTDQKDRYRTCCWDLREEQARLLVGGWLYLHPETKGDPSAFGGRIIDYQVTGSEEGYPGRIAFIFDAREEGRKQLWRGLNHGMAWTGGPVPANFPHEIENA